MKEFTIGVEQLSIFSCLYQFDWFIRAPVLQSTLSIQNTRFRSQQIQVLKKLKRLIKEEVPKYIEKGEVRTTRSQKRNEASQQHPPTQNEATKRGMKTKRLKGNEESKNSSQSSEQRRKSHKPNEGQQKKRQDPARPRQELARAPGHTRH